MGQISSGNAEFEKQASGEEVAATKQESDSESVELGNRSDEKEATEDSSWCIDSDISFVSMARGGRRFGVGWDWRYWKQPWK